MNRLIILGFGSLAFGLSMATVVGGLAKNLGQRRGYPRKVFHLGIFIGAVPALLFGGFWGAVLFGGVISVIVLVALWCGPGLPLFSALARGEEGTDARQSILGPLISTALGGAASVLLVGRFAVVGFLVCGLGDAAGEPVGQAWGRHPFRGYPWADGAPTRTLEGSLAVFGAGTVGAAVALGLLGVSTVEVFGVGLACGATGAVAEGLSGKGSDNFWIQVIPSLMAWWLVG
ncbi:MAG: hypothetical protein PVJ76_01585 [Gemmatimonadota bacterium]|jgi:dolichol kinase